MVVLGGCGSFGTEPPVVTEAGNDSSVDVVEASIEAAPPTDGGDAATDAADGGEPKRVFVTRDTTTSAMGGLDGADQFCMQAAIAAKLVVATSLNGSFRAWIATADTSPAKTFTKSATGYVRIDGKRVAASWADLVDGKLENPIDVDEEGTSVEGDFRVFTNVTPEGTVAQKEICEDWTILSNGETSYGIMSARDQTWTLSNERAGCTSNLRLYCFEQ